MNTEGQKSIVVDQGLIKLLGRKLYNSSTSLIVLRELIQNAVDSYGDKTGIVNITLDKFGNKLFGCSVEDCGIGMNEDVLTNVFLSIGSSLKINSSSVGGFGIAKVSIFACDTWSVLTRGGYIDNNLVFTPSKRKKAGTVVTVKYPEDYFTSRHLAILNCNNHSRVRLKIDDKIIKRYDGKTVTYLRVNGMTAKISIARSLPYVSGYAIYRINGLVQFLDYASITEANILVDFDGIGYRATDDNYPFSMSRESVLNVWSEEVRKVIDKIEADKHSSKRQLDRDSKVRKSAMIGGYDTEYSGSRAGILTLHEKRVLEMARELLDVMGFKAIRIGLLAGDKIDELAHLSDDIIRIRARDIKHDTVGGYVFGLFGLLCHELTHLDYETHDEDFTIHHVELMRRSGDEIYENLPQLVKKYRVLSRK